MAESIHIFIQEELIVRNTQLYNSYTIKDIKMNRTIVHESCESTL